MATLSNPDFSDSQRTRTFTRRDMLRYMGFAAAAAVVPSMPLGAAKADGGKKADLTGKQPGFYRFKVGDAEGLALVDGGMAMPPEKSPFQVEAPQVKEALANALLPTDVFRLSFSVQLLRIGGELVLIDTGAGPLFGDAAGHMTAHMKAAGVDPADISAVIITHMHGDHFGGLLTAEDKPAFPGAKLYIHEVEYDYWMGKKAEEASKDSVGNVRRYLNAFKGKWQMVKGGDKPVSGVEVIDAFGHTPGHMNLSIESAGERLYHIADCAHHHAISFAHPEWMIAFDIDKQQGMKTRKEVLARVAKEKVRISGGHMPFPTLGHVRPMGDAYDYMIEPWQVS